MVKMLVTFVPDDRGDEKTKDMVVRAKVIETKVKGICKSLRKESVYRIGTCLMEEVTMS